MSENLVLSRSSDFTTLKDPFESFLTVPILPYLRFQLFTIILIILLCMSSTIFGGGGGGGG